MDPQELRKGAELALNTLIFCTFHNDTLKAGELREAILKLFGPEIDAEVQRSLECEIPFN